MSIAVFLLEPRNEEMVLNTMSWAATADPVPNQKPADRLRPLVAALTLSAMLLIVLLIWLLSSVSQRGSRRPGRIPA